MKRKTAAPAKKATAKTGPRARTAGSARKPAVSPIRQVGNKTREVLDHSLAQLSPTLKKKLEVMKSQWTVGDLQVLGLKVLERAREISESVRTAAGDGRPAKKSRPARTSKKS